jgi:hypothetical protein
VLCQNDGFERQGDSMNTMPQVHQCSSMCARQRVARNHICHLLNPLAISSIVISSSPSDSGNISSTVHSWSSHRTPGTSLPQSTRGLQWCCLPWASMPPAGLSFLTLESASLHPRERERERENLFAYVDQDIPSCACVIPQSFLP